MTDGIAHQVHERIHHPLDQKLIDLRFATAQLHDNLLAALPREVTYDERHAFKDLTDLDHANAHHALAQVSQLPRDAQARFLQRTPDCGRRRSFQVSHLIIEPRTADDEFADNTHQFVEPVEINAHHSRWRHCRHSRALFRPLLFLKSFED